MVTPIPDRETLRELHPMESNSRGKTDGIWNPHLSIDFRSFRHRHETLPSTPQFSRLASLLQELRYKNNAPGTSKT